MHLLLLVGACRLSFLGKIHGKTFPVRSNLNFLSAHADDEELLIWLEGVKEARRKVFFTHDKPEGAQALEKELLEERS